MRIEDAHRFNLVPEPLQADRRTGCRREDVQDPAADGKLTFARDEIRPLVAKG
jgi:hypothetical protein